MKGALFLVFVALVFASKEHSKQLITDFFENLHNSSDVKWLSQFVHDEASLTIHILGSDLLPDNTKIGLYGRKEELVQGIHSIAADLQWQFALVPDMRLKLSYVLCTAPETCIVYWEGSGTIKGDKVQWQGGASIGIMDHKIMVVGGNDLMEI